MEKFRRVGASIWKNLLLYEGRGRTAADDVWNIKKLFLREAGTIRALSELVLMRVAGTEGKQKPPGIRY